MAPTNKAKAAGVSSGSFLELRAQVAKRESLSKGNATTVAHGKKSSSKVRVHSSFDSYTFRMTSPLTEAE